MSNKSLIIVGASARAAAASAQRAGFAPYWLDQFGDTDLRQRFPGQVISPYPGQAVKLIDQAPEAPFIYTGAHWKTIRLFWHSLAHTGLCWAIRSQSVSA